MSSCTRRTLFKAAATVPFAGLVGPGLGTRMAFASTTTYDQDVLLVLSLRGGFDGLSAVVPGGDPAYYAARPTIAVPQASLLPLDAMFGLHPALLPLHPLWSAGQLAAVVGVGQVDPTRSHFEATEQMERAAPSSSLRTGWLDRALGLRGIGTVFQAVQVGGSPGQQFAGPAPELSIGAVDDFGLGAAWDPTEAGRWNQALGALYAQAPTTLAAPAKIALGALSGMAKLKADGYVPGATYDESSDLAKALRDVARLIKADLGLQVAAVDFGDWDMHEGLGTVDSGRMKDQLTELAGALAAFWQDLGSLTGKVTVVTLSEFGRRVEQNDSSGVDHGHGNTMLLLGGNVQGGQVHGSWSGLAADRLDDGDVAGTTDYRSVLAEVLRVRCGQSSLDSVFPGLPPGSLGVVRAG